MIMGQLPAQLLKLILQLILGEIWAKNYRFHNWVSKRVSRFNYSRQLEASLAKNKIGIMRINSSYIVWFNMTKARTIDSNRSAERRPTVNLLVPKTKVFIIHCVHCQGPSVYTSVVYSIDRSNKIWIGKAKISPAAQLKPPNFQTNYVFFQKIHQNKNLRMKTLANSK